MSAIIVNQPRLQSNVFLGNSLGYVVYNSVTVCGRGIINKYVAIEIANTVAQKKTGDSEKSPAKQD
jgi:hypothetical protein